LLRVCKRIHPEAAEVFYGENEFRFSGVNGWIVVNAFVATIGIRHARFVKVLTIGMPFWAKNRGCTYGTSRCLDSSTQRERLEGIMLWTYPSKLGSYYDSAFDLLSWNLAKAGTLKKLNLILPDWFDYTEVHHSKTHDELWAALNRILSKLPRLTVEVIYMCPEDNFKEMGDSIKRLVRELRAARIRVFRLAYYQERPFMRPWVLVEGEAARDFQMYIAGVISDSDN
jgi:hypothetical protein